MPRVLACWWPVQLRPRDAKRPHTGLHQALSQNRGAAPPTGLCAEACTTQPNTATSGVVMPGQSCLPLPQMGHIPHVWMSAVACPGGQRPPWLRAWPGNSSQDVPSLHATGSPWATKHMVPGASVPQAAMLLILGVQDGALLSVFQPRITVHRRPRTQ